jgi:hypothetical protein
MESKSVLISPGTFYSAARTETLESIERANCALKQEEGVPIMGIEKMEL